MTPWRNSYLKSSAVTDPLDDVTLQRDSARDLASILEERNEKALRLHAPRFAHAEEPAYRMCKHCIRTWPCPTVRALTGADEDDQ